MLSDSAWISLTSPVPVTETAGNGYYRLRFDDGTGVAETTCLEYHSTASADCRSHAVRTGSPHRIAARRKLP